MNIAAQAVFSLFLSTGEAKTMASGDIVYEKIHFRHEPKWSGRLGTAEGGLLLCVACAIEMVESEDVAVRKMLNCFSYRKSESK